MKNTFKTIFMIFIGAGIVFAWQRFQLINMPLPELQATSLPTPPLPPLTFDSVSRVCKPGWSETLQASDGEYVCDSGSLIENPHTPEEAIQQDLSRNCEILETTKKRILDSSETTRYVVSREVWDERQLPLEKKGTKKQYEIMWVQGIFVCRLTGPSLRHVIALEKYRNY